MCSVVEQTAVFCRRQRSSNCFSYRFKRIQIISKITAEMIFKLIVSNLIEFIYRGALVFSALCLAGQIRLIDSSYFNGNESKAILSKQSVF